MSNAKIHFSLTRNVAILRCPWKIHVWVCVYWGWGSPARILSSSDPWVPGSCSQPQLTKPSVQRCLQSTCRWNGSCPSHTEARYCIQREKQTNRWRLVVTLCTDLCFKTKVKSSWYIKLVLTLLSQWHQFHWTCPVHSNTELQGRLLHPQPAPSFPCCQLGTQLKLF